jgi:hypothetical protein
MREKTTTSTDQWHSCDKKIQVYFDLGKPQSSGPLKKELIPGKA